jgi:hypothetical protein
LHLFAQRRVVEQGAFQRFDLGHRDRPPDRRRRFVLGKTNMDQFATGLVAGQSPITRASGKKTIVPASLPPTRRLGDAPHQQAYSRLERIARRSVVLRRYASQRNRAYAALRHWPTGSSASCTDASRAERPTMK